MNELFKVALQADVGGFVKGMVDAQNATQRVQTGLQGIVNVGKAANSVLTSALDQTKKWGKEAIASGVGIEAMALSWGVAASIFDTNMRNVNSLLDLSESKFQSLSRSVLTLGAAFPQGPNNAAQGMYEIVSAGYSAADATTLLKVSLTAASAGMTDTNTAADAVVYALKAYGLGVSSANDVSDILFKTVDLGILKFSDLAQGMGEWVAMAAAAKVPLGDAAAAIAAMTLAGAPPAEAATSLARIMTSFIKPAADLTVAAQQLGFQTPLLMLQTLGLAGTMDKLRVSTGGNVQEIETLFHDIRAGRGVFELMSNDGQNYASVADQIGVASNRAGATQAAFGAQSQGAAFKFKIMINELNRLAISLGTPLLIPAKGFFDIVAGGAKTLGDLPPVVDAIVGGVVVLGGALVIGAGVVMGYGLSFTLTTLALNLMGKSLDSLSVKIAAQGFEEAASKIAVIGAAADHSGGSMIRFGWNLTNAITTRIPILSTIVTHLKDLLLGLGLATVALAAGIYVWKSYTDQVTAFNDAVSKMETDKIGSLHFENLQEASDSLAIMREQLVGVNKAEGDLKDSGVLHTWDQILGSAASHLPFVGSLFDSTMIKTIQQSKAYNDVLNKTLDNLNYLKEIGTTVSNQVFTDFWKSGNKMPDGFQMTTQQILALADFKGIKLIDSSGNQDPAALKQLVSEAEDYVRAYGALPSALHQSAAEFKTLTDARQKFVDSVTAATEKSLSSSVDPLSQFNNQYFESKFASTSKKLGTIKGEFKNVFSYNTLADFYSSGIDETGKFLDNIQTAVKKGFDPNFITRIIQAGPKAAGDLLDTIANSTDSRFLSTINNAEAKLAQLTAYGVQMARLLAIATAPGTSESQAGQLPTAMKIEQAHLAFPSLTDSQIGQALHMTQVQVQAVANSYGIQLAVSVPTAQETLSGTGGQVKQNLDDTVTMLRRYLGASVVGSSDNYTRNGFISKLLTGDTSLMNSNMKSAADIAADKAGAIYGNAFKNFTIDAPFKINKDTFEKNMSEQLKVLNPNLTDEQVQVTVDLLYKDQVAKQILTGGNFDKPGVKDFIVGLIGDKEATSKIEAVQSTLKLTPSELYTTFGIIGDKDAQRKIIEYMAKIGDANAQKVVVQVDSSGIAHFYPTLLDAEQRIHEIGAQKVAPSVDLKTGQFYSDVAAVNAALYGIPSSKNIEIMLSGQPATMQQIQSFAAALRGGGQKAIADGGFVRFADGGTMEYHQAEISPQGTTRIWNEPETGGEAYIPLSPNKRGRSLGIMQQVAQHFGVEHFADGGINGIISSERSHAALTGYYAGSMKSDPSFSNAVHDATAGLDPKKDAVQIAQATIQALQQVATTYQSVRDAAGATAANALAMSGLTGVAWTNAAQRIIDAAKGAKVAEDNLNQAKFDTGNLSAASYEAFLKKRLASTAKFSAEYMGYWNQIKTVQAADMKEGEDRNAWQYANGMRSYASELKFLQSREGMFKQGTADYRNYYDQIKSLEQQHNADVATQQDYEYTSGNASLEQYTKQLQDRLKAQKAFSQEWYATQQQLQQISKSFSDPFKQATDVITAFSGKAVSNFSDVKAFYTHTIQSSKDFMATIVKLKKEGVNQSFLDDLMKQGPSALPLAQSILGGGADAAKFINDSLTQINAITGQAAQMSGASTAPAVSVGSVSIIIGAGSSVTKAEIGSMVNAGFEQLASKMAQKVKR